VGIAHVPNSGVIPNVEKAVFGLVISAKGVPVAYKANVQQLQIVVPDFRKISLRCDLIAVSPENRSIWSQIFPYQWFIPARNILDLEVIEGIIEKSENHRPAFGTIEIPNKFGIRDDLDRRRSANIPNEISRASWFSYRGRLNEARGFGNHVRAFLALGNVSLFFRGFSQLMGINPTSMHLPPLEADEYRSESRHNYGNLRPSQGAPFKSAHFALYLLELIPGFWLCIRSVCGLGHLGRKGHFAFLQLFSSYALVIHGGCHLLHAALQLPFPASTPPALSVSELRKRSSCASTLRSVGIERTNNASE
jgi:hypothetical protein